MILARCLMRPLARLASKFRDDRCGTSAIEFALVLPVLLTVYIGGTEISNAIAIDRKVTLTARTVTDLVSRASSISTGDMGDVLIASAAVMSPYLPNYLSFTVSEVHIDNNGNATVWGFSCSYQGTPRNIGDPVTLPSQLIVNNSYLIWGEAQYSYTPPIAYVISGTLNLTDQIFMSPRMSSSVTGPPSCPTSFTPPPC
ncbi:MAG: pilus assembly protein [Pseudolabrys sp.]|nr:pilus assembly protein [Pseudolabrys sp.]